MTTTKSSALVTRLLNNLSENKKTTNISIR